MHCTKEIKELFTVPVQFKFIVDGCGIIKEGNKKFFGEKNTPSSKEARCSFLYTNYILLYENDYIIHSKLGWN